MSEVVEKWGKSVAERGFAQIPNYLLFLNQWLDDDNKLGPAELSILFQLAGAWWKKAEYPYPALRTLAVRSGISDRQAQRAVTRLEKIGFLKRVKRKAGGLIASNAYDLSPLVRFLDVVAKAFPNEFPRKVSEPVKAELAKALAEPTEDKPPIEAGAVKRKPLRLKSKA